MLILNTDLFILKKFLKEGVRRFNVFFIDLHENTSFILFSAISKSFLGVFWVFFLKA